MGRIAGVTVERTYQGTPKFITIDLRKYPDMIPVLQEKGLLNVPNNETVKAMEEAESGEVTRVKDMKDFKKKIYG